MVSHSSAPPPDLRIVPTATLRAHEEHDSQRSVPLAERLRHESIMINPPVVAPMRVDEFVILDGANRVHAFEELAYPHILVQVTPYETGQVELSTWNHVIGNWDSGVFLAHLDHLDGITVIDGHHADSIAHVVMRNGGDFTLQSSVHTTQERNAALRRFVSLYQRNARLHRTADIEVDQAWRLYPEATALVTFPLYQPSDIIEAAREKAFLPPGVSRHIVHGRAIRVNYPLDMLREVRLSLDEKNAALRTWMQTKLANRQVRYYAEATYQFDE